jgi:hypothetical protein
MGRRHSRRSIPTETFPDSRRSPRCRRRLASSGALGEHLVAPPAAVEGGNLRPLCRQRSHRSSGLTAERATGGWIDEVGILRAGGLDNPRALHRKNGTGERVTAASRHVFRSHFQRVRTAHEAKRSSALGSDGDADRAVLLARRPRVTDPNPVRRGSCSQTIALRPARRRHPARPTGEPAPE